MWTGRNGRSRRDAVAMDGPGDQFLAGAALAGDEDAGVARRHQGDALEDRLHGRAAADDLLGAGRPAQSARRAAAEARPGAEGPRHRFEGLVEVERLGQVIERPALDGPDRGVEVAEGGHDDHRRIVATSCRSRPRAVRPSMPGSRTSRMIASGRCLLGLAKASSADAATATLVPFPVEGRCRAQQTASSSSTIRMCSSTPARPSASGVRRGRSRCSKTWSGRRRRSQVTCGRRGPRRPAGQRPGPGRRPPRLPVTNGSNSRPATSRGGPGPRVDHLDDGRCRCSSRSQCNLDGPAARPGGLDGVADHVEEQVRRAGRHRQRRSAARVSRCQRNSMPGVPALRPEQGDGLVEQVGQSHRSVAAQFVGSARGRGNASGGLRPGPVGAGRLPTPRSSSDRCALPVACNWTARRAPATPLRSWWASPPADLAEQPKPLGLSHGLLESRQVLGHVVDRPAEVAQFVVAAGQRHRQKSPAAISAGPALQFLDIAGSAAGPRRASTPAHARPPTTPKTSDGRMASQSVTPQGLRIEDVQTRPRVRQVRRAGPPCTNTMCRLPKRVGPGRWRPLPPRWKGGGGEIPSRGGGSPASFAVDEEVIGPGQALHEFEDPLGEREADLTGGDADVAHWLRSASDRSAEATAVQVLSPTTPRSSAGAGSTTGSGYSSARTFRSTARWVRFST